MLQFSLVGYDPKTERLMVETRIPASAAVQALQVARITTEQLSGAVGDLPLDADQALAIARLIDAPIKPTRFDYFLEVTAPVP